MFDASNFFKCLFSLATSKSLAREKPGNYSDIAQNRDKSHKELFFMSKSPRVSNSVVVPRGLRKQRRLGLVCKDIVESFYCFAYRCRRTHAPIIQDVTLPLLLDTSYTNRSLNKKLCIERVYHVVKVFSMLQIRHRIRVRLDDLMLCEVMPPLTCFHSSQMYGH